MKGLNMSREIKFRAWDHESNGWLDAEWWAISPDGTSITWSDMSDSYTREVNDGSIVLLQYTGLKDKSGVEIYEGDIVKAGNGHVGELKYLLYAFYVDGFWNSSFDVPGDAFSEDEEIEVIGNIYENPDLLNKE